MTNYEAQAKSRAQLFDEEHGAAVRVDGWWHYHDGAMRERDPMGALVDPPNDPAERSRLIVFYNKQRLQRARDAFQEQKNYLLAIGHSNMKSYSPSPPSTILDELKEFKKVVEEWQSKLESAEEEHEKLVPSRLRDKEKGRAKSLSDNERFMATIKAIKV